MKVPDLGSRKSWLYQLWHMGIMLLLFIAASLLFSRTAYAATTQKLTFTVGDGVYVDYWKISETEGNLIIKGSGSITDTTSKSENTWGYLLYNLIQKVHSDSNGFAYLCPVTSVTVAEDANIKFVGETRDIFANWTDLKTVDISSIDFSESTSLQSMFYYCTSLESVKFNLTGTNKVESLTDMFLNCRNLTDIEGLNTLDTSNVTSMVRMFSGCKSLASIDITNFNIGNVYSTKEMFKDCNELVSLSNANFDMSSVTDMTGMFQNCYKLESLNFKNWNANKVMYTSYMFQNCHKLESLDLSGFETPNLSILDYMFKGCTSLKSLNISSFNLSNDYVPDAVSWPILEGCNNLRVVYTPLANGYWGSILLGSEIELADDTYFRFVNCTDKVFNKKYKSFGSSLVSKELRRIVPYTVNHYKETEAGSGIYEEIPSDVDNLYGAYDYEVTPEAKEYEGYSLVETKTIKLDLDSWLNTYRNADGTRKVDEDGNAVNGEIQQVVNYYYNVDAKSLSVDYNGPDIYEGKEADPDDFTVTVTYVDDTTKTIDLKDCVVTNPNEENTLVVPAIQYNTFRVSWSNLSDTTNVWGYKVAKVKARYLGDPILVGNDYAEEEVEVTYVYTPYSDGTTDEKIVTENIQLSSLTVTQEGSNGYTVVTPEGEAEITVPGKVEPDTPEDPKDETVSGNDNTVSGNDNTVSGNDNKPEETVSGNDNKVDETVSGNNKVDETTPSEDNKTSEDTNNSASENTDTTTDAEQSTNQNNIDTATKSPTTSDSFTLELIIVAIITLIIKIARVQFKNN